MAKKELTWNNMNEEEVKMLDLKAFLQYIPSRQRRTLTRGFTDAQKILLKNLETGKDNLKTHCRDMVILPKMIGKTFRVYTGRDFAPITITLEMIGHYLGEFAHTRKSVSHSSAGVGATRSSKSTSAR
ncbi:30S ribosomal protein S19 [Candidatus Woesearchaeota archaeon CG10_big_fil_rev_8_21_14_0_10_32_24]|nr:MAG: 30S ribosomal protein S19 [Candidatus Woesearchaeota archaeon CG10_big_fil_rev_8_21_14_0_10_32_24]